MRLMSLATSGLAAAAVATMLAAPAFAQDVPQQLRGKSVVVNWTEHRLQRRAGEGEFRPRSIPQLLQVYISTEGRIFERRTATGRRGSGSRESVGAGAMGRNAETSFQGRSLVVLAGTRAGGARSIALEFDEGFAACKVKVTVGREGGAEVVRGRSIVSGNAVEFKPQGTSGESCAVRDGNVFSQ